MDEPSRFFFEHIILILVRHQTLNSIRVFRPVNRQTWRFGTTLFSYPLQAKWYNTQSLWSDVYVFDCLKIRREIKAPQFLTERAFLYKQENIYLSVLTFRCFVKQALCKSQLKARLRWTVPEVWMFQTHRDRWDGSAPSCKHKSIHLADISRDRTRRQRRQAWSRSPA